MLAKIVEHAAGLKLRRKQHCTLARQALKTERVHREALEEDISKCKQQTEAVQPVIAVSRVAH